MNTEYINNFNRSLQIHDVGSNFLLIVNQPKIRSIERVCNLKIYWYVVASGPEFDSRQGQVNVCLYAFVHYVLMFHGIPSQESHYGDLCVRYIISIQNYMMDFSQHSPFKNCYTNIILYWVLFISLFPILYPIYLCLIRKGC